MARIYRIHFARFRSFATRKHKFFGALLTLFHVLRSNNWRATIFFYLRIKYVWGENKKILPCFLLKTIHDVSHQVSRHFYRLLRFFHHHHFKWKGVGFYCFKMNVKQKHNWYDDVMVWEWKCKIVVGFCLSSHILSIVHKFNLVAYDSLTWMMYK